MLPNDLAGKVRELSAYDFESARGAQRFEQLMDKLREQLMQQMVDQMSSAVQNMTPEDMARMKDMMAALNEMIERQQRGEDPQFEQFMEQFGDFFPENPQNLEELLQQMAQRMAAMQAMLNSMTPEQRAQLQQLSDQLLEDMDLRWQMDQLGQNLRGMFPQMGGTRATTSRVRTRWAWPRRCRRCRSSAISTSSRTCCATPPTRVRSPRPTWTACAS
jgi:uncharacterized protein with von Willebrand factor type A (vWA) domain